MGPHYLIKFENECGKQYPRMQRSFAEDHGHGEQGGEKASGLETERAARAVFKHQGSRRRGLANTIQVGLGLGHQSIYVFRNFTSYIV